MEKIITQREEKTYKKRYIRKIKKSERIKVHDSLVKEILNKPKELKSFMKDFFNLDIEENDIENYNREFRTKLKLRTRIMDLLYKIKGSRAYILIEHQSTVDYKIAKRIGEYCLVVIENDGDYINKRKNAKAPVIYPIVLSTSKNPWDAPITIIQDEDNKYKFPPLTYPKYNVVDINNYTMDFLLERRTGIGLFMAFEKVRTVEDFKYITRKIKNLGGANKAELETTLLVVERLEEVMPWITKVLKKAEIEEIKKKITNEIMKGGKTMVLSNFETAIANIIEENVERGRAEGITQGKSEGITETIKGFLKQKVDDNIIINATGISKEELEKLKLQMV